MYILKTTTISAITVVAIAAGMMPPPVVGGFTSVLTSPGGGSITQIGTSVPMSTVYTEEANTNRQVFRKIGSIDAVQHKIEKGKRITKYVCQGTMGAKRK